MRNTWKLGVAALALALGVLFLAENAEAQKTKGKSRPAATKYLMKGVVQPNCATLGKVLKDNGPTDEKGWEEATLLASVLNEMSYVLMDDGRCPDKDWAGAATALRASSAKILDAAKEKNTAEAQSAFKAVTGSCATCHKAHKAKK